MDPFTFNVPVKLHFGRGQLGYIYSIAKELGKKALLVTHPWHDSRGNLLPQAKACEAARGLLEKEGVHVVVYDKVQPNPDVADIDAGAAIARDNGVEFIVGMGGGSAMDSAKAISLVASLGGSAWDYLFFKKPVIARGLLPIITVTTTSGTGSHMTNIAVVSNRRTSEKYPIVHARLYAAHAICDPELMLTIPGQPTIETGFDVFAHAFESYTARNASPIVDTLAFNAMSIVTSSLLKLSTNLHDIALREAMALADTLAGICIANVGTTVPHAMGQPISALAPKISHGLSLMMVYPPFLRRSAAGAPAKFIDVGRLFDSTVQNPQAAAEAICSWIRGFNLPGRLHDAGIEKADIDDLQRQCIVFKKVDKGPVNLDADDIRSMYSEIL